MNFKGKQQKLWLAVGILSLALLAVAGWQMTMGYFAQTDYASPSYAVDVTNDRELVGLAHDVFFGKVTDKQGQTLNRGFPETQFSVRVLDPIKGNLSGDIQVNQHGGRDLSGRNFRMSDDPDLLSVGSTYLFVTRTNSGLGWRTVLSGRGKIKLDVPADASDYDILKSLEADKLRIRFIDAVENQIPYDP